MIDIQKSTHAHPIFQLLYLALFSILGAVFFTIIGMAVYFVFFNDADFFTVMQNPMQDLAFLRCSQIGSSVGLFIAGPLAFAAIEKYQIKTYYQLHTPLRIPLLTLSVALLVFGMPLFEAVAALNQNMSLPEGLKGLEKWMRIKEDEAEMLTMLLLKMDGYGDLVINLIMIALIPAIGEELMFRGALTNIFGRWIRNPHIVIWLTAIIFSAIHIQFFGFFPRMLLGALFGYLLYWGGNIGYAMLGHFVNNGLAVIVAFVLQQQGKDLDRMDQIETFNALGYVLSAIITVALLFAFYREQYKNKNDEQFMG